MVYLDRDIAIYFATTEVGEKAFQEANELANNRFIK